MKLCIALGSLHNFPCSTESVKIRVASGHKSVGSQKLFIHFQSVCEINEYTAFTRIERWFQLQSKICAHEKKMWAKGKMLKQLEIGKHIKMDLIPLTGLSQKSPWDEGNRMVDFTNPDVNSEEEKFIVQSQLMSLLFYSIFSKINVNVKNVENKENSCLFAFFNALFCFVENYLHFALAEWQLNTLLCAPGSGICVEMCATPARIIC